ncbi:MAG TPA: glycoside hydrolase family 97 protein [Chitinophagaceae bacterium]|nr:glycoside hydrolase family 97 protein [Chitinophagaceae bacterium]
MKLFQKLLLFIPPFISVTVLAQKPVQLLSPNKEIVFNFRLINKAPVYSVAYKGKLIIDNSRLGIIFTDGSFDNNITIGKPAFLDSTEDYTLVTGKASHVRDSFRQVIIPLQQSSTGRKINLVAKAFNDGLAFRYEFLAKQGTDSMVITDENTTFNFTGNPIVRALFLPNYTTSHEGPYTTLPLSEVPDTLMDMPVLFQRPDNIFIGVTEAQLLDYAGMYLEKENGIVTGKLSPWPGQTLVKVRASLPHKSPWRVMLISDRVGALIESNIITSLNDPCAIKDVSWIKPGTSTFPWWNGNVTPDTLNAPGNNFVTNQYYIDFCARNHITYHSVVEYGLHQWYTDDGVGFQPGPHNDVTKPVPGLDMKEICDYGKSVGVGVRVWVHFYALYPRLDTAFAVFEKWGLSGMMVDFMDRDDQLMVNMQTEILQKAAAHHLHIQFHGAYKPTGLNRTYPNEFTREGTRNYECNKWGPGLTADHDIYMPFTRLLAGSTDYHLGGFRAVPDSAYVAQYTRPLMLGTRCHMLAMYVVLQNALSMVCDYPAAYEGQPGFEFIQQVPTNWDETKVPGADVEKYVAVARKKDNDWYIGAITNHEARTINVPLSFLGDGTYTAEIYTDAPDVDKYPNHLVKQTKAVTKNDVLTLPLAAGGGAAVHIRK